MQSWLPGVVANPSFFLAHRPFSQFPSAFLFVSLHPHHANSNPMSSQPDFVDPTSQMTPITLQTQNYPTPLSPPYPPISKQIEVARAMTASSRSSLFTFLRSDVLFEDRWLVAVNKPQGVYCETVLEKARIVLAESSESTGLSNGSEASPPELHMANRLDRDTSGVMVISKSHKVASKLVKAYTDHKVKKTYIAICIGSAPKWEKITVKSGHGRSKFGAWRVYAASDVGQTLPGGSSVRDMETSFEVLSVNEQASFKGLSEFNKDEKVIVAEGKAEIEGDARKDKILIRAFPRSGRTHQIRLHCQYLGIPIRGDVKYGGVHKWEGKTCESHELHAESLSLQHPVTGLPLKFHAPLPPWATQLLLPL